MRKRGGEDGRRSDPAAGWQAEEVRSRPGSLPPPSVARNGADLSFAGRVGGQQARDTGVVSHDSS